MGREPAQGKGGTQLSSHEPYLEWIKGFEQQLYETQSVRGLCWSACQEMLEMFPELLLVRGHAVDAAHQAFLCAIVEDEYYDPADGHWWLETVNGQIVDPTRKQFGDVSLVYVAFNESKADTLPTGKCCNCGEYCYGGRTELCCEECERAYHAYLMEECRGVRR